MKKRSLVAASAAAALGLLVPAAPGMASAAEVTVTWEITPADTRGGEDTCDDPTIVSSKDISNLVYVIDGETFTIEFSDEEQGTEYTIDGAVTEVWVKSGNNKSGDGSGLGEHFEAPCGDGGGGGGGGGGDA